MKLNKTWVLSFSLAVSLSLIAACSDVDESGKENNEESVTQEEGSANLDGGESAEQMEMTEPDLEGIPDVVAEVNGKEITKEEFEIAYTGQFMQASMQSQMTGEVVDQDQLKKQIAESMIGSELLIQEANSRSFKVSEDDIEKILDELIAQNGLESKDEFMAVFKEQGMDEKEVMSLLEIQVKIDQLIASESGDIKPTDEELKELYDLMVVQQEQMGGEADIPSFDEMKPDLIKQVQRQNEAEASEILVERLRKDGDVTNNL
ncbi:SurA N-terminal domain-containing protein [Bacillaceae bacterium IKA-2]|nr:SurA N-terminal domain-containing protein [Bacillaceae bacterium IKA-2]